MMQCEQEDCLRRQALFFPLDGWDVERDVGPRRRNLVPMSLSSRSSGPSAVFSYERSRTGGSAASFNASNHEYYLIPEVSLFDRQLGYRIVSNVSVWEQGMTLAFWLRFGSEQGQWQSIIEFSNGFDTEHIYVRRVASSSELAFGVMHSMKSVQREFATVNSTLAIADTRWQHIAWTVLPVQNSKYYDAVWNIYVDGSILFEGIAGVMPIDGPYTLNYIGYGTLVDMHSFFTGQMDDLRLYERALLPLSILKIYSMDACCGTVVGSYLDARRSCSGKETFDQVLACYMLIIFVLYCYEADSSCTMTMSRGHASFANQTVDPCTS